MIKAAFPGSFDPLTYGHLDIIERAAGIFDELLVVVAETHQKEYMFSAEERRTMITKLTQKHENVSVAICRTLIVDFLENLNINVMVRGVRNVPDFSYESELSMMNKALSPRVETIFMITRPEFLILRSSSVRELASFNGNLSALVPPVVEQALKNKFKDS
ncbi:MAG: pantetheine-phosphate adenylyltransferase [Spirochaetaceae bacterium]|jgi:pantetheine-phosphate adenylyltransferase|nr:pantetheine-phosphate adenylyltransferase [Spirochaetaceae bacterium]